jgi:hypothetical protein
MPEGTAAGDAARIVGSIAQPSRLRVVAGLVLGSSTVPELIAATGLSRRVVVRELARLSAVALVTSEGPRESDAERYKLREADVVAAAQTLARLRAPADRREAPGTPQEKVRRTFLKDGRLVSIPAARSKRLVVLDFLAQGFEPGTRYPEREVNRRLRVYHPDVASLRRYLVDEGFLERARGEYWRSGGTFDVG